MNNPDNVATRLSPTAPNSASRSLVDTGDDPSERIKSNVKGGEAAATPHASAACPLPFPPLEPPFDHSVFKKFNIPSIPREAQTRIFGKAFFSAEKHNVNHQSTGWDTAVFSLNAAVLAASTDTGLEMSYVDKGIAQSFRLPGPTRAFTFAAVEPITVINGLLQVTVHTGTFRRLVDGREAEVTAYGPATFTLRPIGEVPSAIRPRPVPRPDDLPSNAQLASLHVPSEYEGFGPNGVSQRFLIREMDLGSVLGASRFLPRTLPGAEAIAATKYLGRPRHPDKGIDAEPIQITGKLEWKGQHPPAFAVYATPVSIGKGGTSTIFDLRGYVFDPTNQDQPFTLIAHGPSEISNLDVFDKTKPKVLPAYVYDPLTGLGQSQLSINPEPTAPSYSDGKR